jgi:tRNA threonylcarbamoyl adenosine modification protein YjeE
MDYESASIADTMRVAKLLAATLDKSRSPCLIALEGDLGAGKTAFAKCLISSLTGLSEGEISSPTFTIMNEYSAREFRICHFDFYRLNSPDELEEVGFMDSLRGAVCIVEWYSKFAGDLRIRPDVSVEISQLTDSKRIIRVVGIAEK